MGKIEDLTGKRFGRLVVNRQAPYYISPKGQKKVQWYCDCDCGTKDVIVSASNLKCGMTQSCGCYCLEKISEYKDITGNKYGKLTATRYYKTINHRAIWYCDCDCGAKDILVKYDYLSSGKKQSCGCLHSEVMHTLHKKYNQYDISGDYGIGYLNDNSEFYFDLEDYDLIKNYYWMKDNYGYIVSMINRKSIRLNRLIMGLEKNNPNVVDHINHNIVDNRKNNLRVCTYSHNNANKSIRKNNTSGVTGVAWNKLKNKWYSTLTFDKKTYFLGYFTNFDDAVAARKQAEEKYFGEYSYDNSMALNTEDENLF